MPLLEEHHYGEQIDVPARYGLAAVRAAVLRRRAADGAEDQESNAGDNEELARAADDATPAPA